MLTKRTLQLGAAAVIANGLVALSIMSPTAAHASSCVPTKVCGSGWTGCSNATHLQSVCAYFHPECTVVSAQCSTPLTTCAQTPAGPVVWVDCNYQ